MRRALLGEPGIVRWEPMAAPMDWVRVEGDWKRGLRLALRFEVRDGVNVCTGLLVESDDRLTSARLRGLDFGALVTLMSGWRELYPGEGQHVSNIEQARAGHEGGRQPGRERRDRRVKWTDERLRDVHRRHYDAQERNPYNPVSTVARDLGVDRSTVHKMLNEARRRGLDKEGGSS
jgi:hypothetical protein